MSAHAFAVNRLPRILITAGEPAGIGPDLCVLIAQESFPCALAVACDPQLLADRAVQLGVPLKVIPVSESGDLPLHNPGTLHVLTTGPATNAVSGQLNPALVNYVLKSLSDAVAACLQGRFDGLVTAPVHKGIINDAGYPFSGHTEFIAEITGGHPVMMLATEGLRVALATTHLPLKDVSSAITQDLLESVLRVLVGDLTRRFGIARPRILICGLNPHAGEDGHLGREEIDVMKPVIERLSREGMELTGPLPADTLFLPKYLEHADAVLAMYHDQGLPVLKYAGFGGAVNITLGLPIIRTSVDHGTALDLAGTGNIETGSLEAAVHMAIKLAMSEATNMATMSS